MTGYGEIFSIQGDDIRAVHHSAVCRSSPAHILNTHPGKITGGIIPEPEKKGMTRSHQ
jgi:hypothetical protein